MMIFTTFRRIIRSGFLGFWRNGFVTFAAILVMTITLFILGGFVFLNAMLDGTVAQIKEKVDVNVYLVPEASDEESQEVITAIKAIPYVNEVTYRSKKEALEEFRLKHKDDKIIISSLDMLDSNPLGGTINITADNPESYESIANHITEKLDPELRQLITKTNYFDNQNAIVRLTEIIKTINWLSVVVLIIFAIVSALITFNTIRLAIYNSREEISVMRLVGASNTYIRGPFVIEGIMYGLVASLFSIILFYPVSLWIGPATKTFFGATDMFSYYVDNFASLFILLLGFGVGLGAISSYLAVRRYLKT